ncbi:DUF3152 domain-containing protein [Pseudokineococcus sp. 1T1Z-3]|uniref:DUF3152 domain-containing protein n=1 Tax=Pseudokineococcus sp. 1T1Z-3 TaxID=3132745 RepID=UPI0030A3F305
MVSRRVVRRRRQVLAGSLVLLVGGLALAVRGGADEGREAQPAEEVLLLPPGGEGTAPGGPADVAQDESAGAPDEPGPAEEPPPEGEGEPDAEPAAGREVTLTDADRAAGVLAVEVPTSGTGGTSVVPGTAEAPEVAPGASVVQVRVLVEDGLPADGQAAAETVMSTLQDPRGWAREGWAFARTDGADGSPEPDVDVVLASPDLTDASCAPLQTRGQLSCRNGGRTVLNWLRWVEGAEAYGEDRVGYRRYLVAHEVGHFLGHGHEGCPAEGAPAPVMLQQSKGLQGCAPNPWPYP